MRKLSALLVVLTLAGCGSETTESAPVVLGPPTDVTANGYVEEVSLLWTAPKGITEFVVYQGATPNTLAPLNNVEVWDSWVVDNAWGASIEGLATGVTHYFAISSVLNGEESERSEVVSAMPVIHTCQDEMIEVREARGAPEEVNTFSSDGYYSEDWWYWSQGWEITFTWGSYVSGCETSIYTFTPH